MNNFKKVGVCTLFLFSIYVVVLGGVSDKKPYTDPNSEASKSSIISTFSAFTSIITSASKDSVLLFSSGMGLMGICSSLYSINTADLETETGKIIVGWNSIMVLLSFYSFLHSVHKSEYL